MGRPPRGRRDEPPTRERIIAAALRACHRTGIDAATTRDIARETGLTEGALYRHFGSRDEIIQAAFLAAAAQLTGRLEAALQPRASLAANLRAVLEAFLEYSETSREAFRLVTADHFAKAGRAPMGIRLPKDLVIDLVSGAKSARIAKAREKQFGDPTLAASLVIGAMLRPIQFRLAGLIRMERKTFLDRVHTAVLRLLKITP